MILNGPDKKADFLAVREALEGILSPRLLHAQKREPVTALGSQPRKNFIFASVVPSRGILCREESIPRHAACRPIPNVVDTEESGMIQKEREKTKEKEEKEAKISGCHTACVQNCEAEGQATRQGQRGTETERANQFISSWILRSPQQNKVTSERATRPN